MWVLLVFPFVLALAARLIYNQSVPWVAWLGVSLLILLILALNADVGTDVIGVGVIFASIVGFLGPEIWQGIQALVRQPRVAGGVTLFVLAAILYATDLLGEIIAISIVCFALWLMVRPLFRRQRG